VLLGDVVELTAARPQRELRLAAPVLRAIGDRLGADREVILVPGNHDVALVRPWLQAHGVPAAVDARIPLDATPLLAAVTALLAPARVRVHYPGVWLSERVWATHGHYLDRHLLPESGFGVARGLLGRLPRDGATPADYEQAGAPPLRRLVAGLGRRLPRPLATWEDDLAELLRAATMPRVPVRLLSHRFAPLTTVLLGVQMQRASIPALVRVVHRLGVDADWVVFGHVHRSGPLPGDDPQQWQGPGERPRIANTGSWVYEPLLLHRASSPHPYWPGGAVLVEDDGDPQAIGLLDAVETLT
jgi:3',5'-cyclic AMP phosphodiesterase CpdA